MQNCKKTKFASREIAHERLSEIKFQDPKCKLKNVYKCNECGFWHLTKMTKANYQSGVLGGGFALQRMIEKGKALAEKKWGLKFDA